MEFLKKSGKIFDIVKVSEKSGNSVFLFIVQVFFKTFFRKDEKYAVRQAKRLI